jgi:16S rRNA (guanine527-N7)-methyltransferase
MEVVPPPPDLEVAAARLVGGDRKRAERFAWHLTTSAVERGLVGPREAGRVWERHILNCAAIATLVPHGSRVMDVGSGAGLPGVVLAIARPDLEVDLVESLQRRAEWLREIIEDLGLCRVTVMRARAEELVSRRGSADVVCARAVAALPKLAGWCMPLLRAQGALLALKGETASEELSAAVIDLRKLGASSWEVVECAGDVLSPPVRVVRVVRGGAPDGGLMSQGCIQ